MARWYRSREFKSSPNKRKGKKRTPLQTSMITGLPNEILQTTVNLLPTKAVLALGQTCRELFSFVKSRAHGPKTLPVPLSRSAAAHPYLDHELIALAAQIWQTTSQELQAKAYARTVKELHILPAPYCSGVSCQHDDIVRVGPHRCDVDQQALVDTLYLTSRCSNLTILRLDIDGIELPKGYLRSFLHLRELQITSTIDMSELAGLSLLRLTVVQRIGKTVYGKVQFDTNQSTIANLPSLTHLYIASTGNYGEIPLLDFDKLPALRYLWLRQEILGDWSVQGDPNRLEILSLDRASPPSGFLQACIRLRHLRIAEDELSEIRLEHLQTLELFNTRAHALLNSALPKLRYFHDFAREGDLHQRRETWGWLNAQRDQKLSVLMSYRCFSDGRRLIDSVSDACQQAQLRKAHLTVAGSFEVTTQSTPWGTIYKRYAESDTCYNHLVDIDQDAAFLGTRLLLRSLSGNELDPNIVPPLERKFRTLPSEYPLRRALNAILTSVLAGQCEMISKPIVTKYSYSAYGGASVWYSLCSQDVVRESRRTLEVEIAGLAEGIY